MKSYIPPKLKKILREWELDCQEFHKNTGKKLFIHAMVDTSLHGITTHCQDHGLADLLFYLHQQLMKDLGYIPPIETKIFILEAPQERQEIINERVKTYWLIQEMLPEYMMKKLQIRLSHYSPT
jgi:hypothetical protein